MNSLWILLFAVVVLLGGYLLYGRWLAKTWGIDPKAKTPATLHNDGKDYTPSSRLTVFAHQFSSIAGAGPVQGPILAAVFGWVPALLWLLIGGVFFGALQDFSALYASVKNDGKSIGLIIEQYIGKKGRKFFTLFCWLFSLLVIAAFTSMTSSTFNGYTTATDGSVTTNFNGAAAATISFLFVGCAIVLGLIQKAFPKMKEGVKILISLALIVFMFAAGMKLPVYLKASKWNYVIMVYLFVAAVAPMWLLMQPRDYMTTFMFLGMIIGGVGGVLVGHPEMKLNAFNGFVVTSDSGAKSYMFPTLFVTIACGAISGFHSLVSSGTSSKTISNETDMLPVGYGAMILETLLGVISLIVVGAVAVNGAVPSGLTPFQIFSQGVAGFLEKFGIPTSVANVFMTMCISALALSTLDSVGRIGRLSFQELFMSDEENMPTWRKVFTNQYFATAVTLVAGYVLCLGGYSNVWALFGSANQLLGALVLMSIAVFMKATHRKSWMFYLPMLFMFCVTFTAIVLNVITNVKAYMAGTAVFLVNGLQLIVALFLVVLAVIVAIHCIKILVSTGKEVETK
jgi:carbon starvation protein